MGDKDQYFNVVYRSQVLEWCAPDGWTSFQRMKVCGDGLWLVKMERTQLEFHEDSECQAR